MQAAILKEARVLSLEDIRVPAADQDFLIVEVKACGICGSDVRYYQGENPWALHTLGRNEPNPPNIILGHEFAGIVKEVKNPKFQNLLGKRVSVLAFDTCGVCEECREDQYHLCKNTRHLGHGAGWGQLDYYPGGMAEFCQVWNTNVVELPDELSFEEATLLDPLSVAIHAITLSGIQPGDDVLVLGLGPVGLGIAQAVRAFGANHVTGTDVYEGALAIAKKAGVDQVVDSTREDVSAAVKKQGGARIVFDTVGTADSQKLAFSLLKESGTLVNLVGNMEQCSYTLMDLAGERRVVCSANNRLEDYLLAIKLICNGTIQAREMISHVLPLAEVQKGFDMMMGKEASNCMKIVLNP